MKYCLTTSDKDIIRSFFCDSKLCNLFITLLEFYSENREGIEFVNRDKIIGFGCPGEHLRGYITKKDNHFYLKLKTSDDLIGFDPQDLKFLKVYLLLNDKNFEENIELYQLATPKELPSEKKPSKTAKKKTTKSTSNKSKEKRNEVFAKLKNRNKAKKFTKQEFKELADWRFGRSFNDDVIIYELPNGNEIQCDSKSEVLLLDYLIKHRLALEIGGQELYLKYDTAFRSGCYYYPDVVVLTKDYHIAVIEVKPVTAMSYHKNMEKYEALREYCEARGYEYMMVDPAHDYMTYDEMLKLRIPKAIENRIDAYLTNLYGEDGECLLEKNDINVLYEEFSDDYKKGEFELFLHALVIQRGWYNKFTNGFMVYETPQRW